MREAHEFTPAEKVQIFDRIHKTLKEDLICCVKDEEHDIHYGWELCVNNVLDYDLGDWENHNKQCMERDE